MPDTSTYFGKVLLEMRFSTNYIVIKTRVSFNSLIHRNLQHSLIMLLRYFDTWHQVYPLNLLSPRISFSPQSLVPVLGFLFLVPWYQLCIYYKGTINVRLRLNYVLNKGFNGVVGKSDREGVGSNLI